MGRKVAGGYRVPDWWPEQVEWCAPCVCTVAATWALHSAPVWQAFVKTQMANMQQLHPAWRGDTFCRHFILARWQAAFLLKTRDWGGGGGKGLPFLLWKMVSVNSVFAALKPKFPWLLSGFGSLPTEAICFSLQVTLSGPHVQSSAECLGQGATTAYGSSTFM